MLLSAIYTVNFSIWYDETMSMNKEILADLLEFYQKLLIQYMKFRRDMPFPTESERDETDGEHAFTLAMIALSLNERLRRNLDSGKIAKYALIHDLVEVHAGDTSVKAPEDEHVLKETREIEAYQKIKEDFATTFPWVHEMIAAYEEKSDPESKFVYIVDKYAGALSWLAGEGDNWKRYYPQEDGSLYHRVVERLRAKVIRFDDPEMLELFDLIHDELEQKRTSYFEQSE